MRITYLHQYFNTPNMSGGTRSFEIARRLIANGHDVTIITTSRSVIGSGGWSITNESGIDVHWLSIPYSNNLSYISRIYAFAKFALLSSIRACFVKTDLIFATSTPLSIAFPALISAFVQRVPLVFEVRDLWPEIPIAIGALTNKLIIHISKLFEKFVYHHSEAVIALSPGMKNGIKKTNYPQERIAVIPNACDNTLFKYDDQEYRSFQDKQWFCDKPLLIYAGTLGIINGVHTLVDIASALLSLNSDIIILIVGDGSQQKSIIKSAISNGVFNKNLFYEPRMSKNEISQLFTYSTMSSSLFIDLPEMRNNSANKFFDTLASGTPVLINYGGWMHDLVQKHQCGLSIWNMNIREASMAIDDFMHNEFLLRLTGNNARTIANVYFDRDLLTDRLIDVLVDSSQRKGYNAELLAPVDFAD